MKRPGELWLSALIALLVAPATLIGLLEPSIYRDPAIVLPQNLGTDAVTLFVVLPLFVAAAMATRRGSWRGRLLWLGGLGYFVYAYGMYALAVRWNALFLVYVAVFGLSLFGFIFGLVNTDPARIRAGFSARVPIRAVASYLIGVAVLVAALWLSEELSALATRTVPPSVVQFDAPTNIVHVFDLGVMLPAMVLAAVALLRRHAWGYVLSGVLLVKASTIGLWVMVMIWFSARQGIGTPAAYTGFFLALTLAGTALAWRYLATLERRRGDVPAPTVPTGMPT